MSEPLGAIVGRVLRDAPFAMRQLAADSGLSYDVLRSWRSGRRRPSRGSARRLADGLERRGEQLLRLARELREESEERTDAESSGTYGGARSEPAASPDVGSGSGPDSGAAASG